MVIIFIINLAGLGKKSWGITEAGLWVYAISLAGVLEWNKWRKEKARGVPQVHFFCSLMAWDESKLYPYAFPTMMDCIPESWAKISLFFLKLHFVRYLFTVIRKTTNTHFLCFNNVKSIFIVSLIFSTGDCGKCLSLDPRGWWKTRP